MMDFFYRIYFALPNFSSIGVIGKAINKLLRIVFREYIYKITPRRLHKDVYCLNQAPRERKVVLSLTTYPDRINIVWITLRTLFRQTYVPDRIVLWLSKEQFANVELPLTITELIDMGLEIKWCDEDLRSYKKFYYALQENKQDLVVTFDDDYYYPSNVVENLIDMYMLDPTSVCATRVHRVKYDKKGRRLPYRQWQANYSGKEVDHLFFTSGAGTLFPPLSYDEEMFNKNVFMQKCFYADDVWLNVMVRKSGIQVVTNRKFDKDMLVVQGSQGTSLLSSNVFEGGNDVQIREVTQLYNIDL